jgi:uncharacterized protein DUF6702
MGRGAGAVVTKGLLAAGAASLVIAVTPARSWAHPLHTTLAEVSIGADGALRITLRAFVDDFSAAVARHVGKPRPADFAVADPDVAAYVAATVVIRDTNGRAVPLAWSGAQRTGDLIWVTVRAPTIHALKGIRASYSTLFDAYPDQVNILQANDGGRRHTVLFTASDGRASKAII